MVIVYDECIISQVIPVQTLLPLLVPSLDHMGWGIVDFHVAAYQLSIFLLMLLLLIHIGWFVHACLSSARSISGCPFGSAARG